jgi:hypothetical protein
VWCPGAPLALRLHWWAFTAIGRESPQGEQPVKKNGFVHGTGSAPVDLAAVSGGQTTSLVENKEGGSFGFTFADMQKRLAGPTQPTRPSNNQPK